MILQYVVDILLDKTPQTPRVDEIRMQLADWDALAQEVSGQRVAVVLTMPAESLQQAFQAATRLAERYGVAVSASVATEEARSKPSGWENVPDLVAVDDVATAQGKTRQAVHYQIHKGQLSARQVGTQWIVLRSDVV
ncbi:hypothetical protein ACFV9C_43790 [Kribbella sp. NPDC059898]|uniref:hypothetical protein n=1 Tax=Kribbella sp. NPDC059898 TaxID=3346995 RepID=UPI003663ADBB